MRLAWKKSQKTLDTSKRLHKNKTRSTGSAGKGLDSQLCHYWELRTRQSAGASRLKASTIGSLILVPPTPKEKVFKVFELKRVDSLLPP